MDDELKNINKRLDKQNKKIDKILMGLTFIGMLIIMFS